MHSVIKSMIEMYKCQTIDDYRNALKEVFQEIALLGLYRGKFFNIAAFYGGTALRMFYDLDRFSEDLDFSLMSPDPNFDLSVYIPYVQNELGAYGLEMAVEEKIKNNNSKVKSAFIKGGTQIHLLKIFPTSPSVSGVNPRELLKIKLEVDIDPPAGAEYEIKYQLLPVPYYVRIYAPSSLFAGKIHALLCREWQNRVKGRDFYDYLWYLSKSIPVNIKHLAERMIQSGHFSSNEVFTEDKLRQLLYKRFSSVNFDRIKKDALPFIKNNESISLWSGEFFSVVTKDKLKIDKA